MRSVVALIFTVMTTNAVANDDALIQEMTREAVFIECQQGECVEFETGVPIDTHGLQYPDGVTAIFPNKEYTVDEQRKASKAIVEEFRRRYGN